MLRGKINAESLSQINKDIEELSPHPQKVKIIAVTKNFSFSAVQEALKYNIINIGENKIQEFEHKQKNKKIPRVTITHFIGRLQRNKVKKAVRLFNIIQSIDYRYDVYNQNENLVYHYPVLGGNNSTRNVDVYPFHINGTYAFNSPPIMLDNQIFPVSAADSAEFIFRNSIKTEPSD